MDTHLIWTPVYNRQFIWIVLTKSFYILFKINPLNMDTG